jgi:hypothetical protein
MVYEPAILLLGVNVIMLLPFTEALKLGVVSGGGGGGFESWVVVLVYVGTTVWVIPASGVLYGFGSDFWHDTKEKLAQAKKAMNANKSKGRFVKVFMKMILKI